MIARNRRRIVAVSVVVIASLVGSLTVASAVPPPPDDADFAALNAHVPVVGHVFEGLTIINRTGLNGNPQRPSAVRCDAELGGQRLRARKLVYGEPKPGVMQVIMCGWRIPANAAGRTLRLWTNDPVGSPGCHCALIGFGGQDFTDSPEYVWRVTRP